MKQVQFLPWAGFWKEAKGTPGNRWMVIQKCFFLFCVLQLSIAAQAQEQKLQYTIQRGGQKVGDLTFLQTTTGTKTVYAVESHVKLKMLLSITVQAWENSVFENNVLQFSSLLRKVNGREHANKQVKKTGSGLTVSGNGAGKQMKNFVVKYSTHCLYAAEPLHFTLVFSDNYQQFVPIKKVAERHYKVTFPDGNSNEYFYENGICKRIRVKSSLFDAEFVLATP